MNTLFEARWQPVETNGDRGEFHFVMNAYDLHLGYPEHVRVERIEERSIKKPGGGAADVQRRERTVRVMVARCESKSICDAEPHSTDAREIIVTPKIMGSTKLYVTATVDGDEEMKDSINVRVQP